MTHSVKFDIGPKTEEYLQRDAKVISPSYTRDYPFVMSHGKGAEVWDVDGGRFIDLTTGIAVNATGHAHPKVVQAIKDQAEKFIHMAGTDFYYGPQTELAERLAGIAPFAEDARIFLCNSGTEAVEGALKLARYYTGRPQFIAFFGGFHGRTMGSLGATSSKIVQRAGYFPMMPGFTHIPYPDPYRPLLNTDGYEDYGERVVAYLEQTVFQTIVPPNEVAAVLVEPIQGEGGYVVPTPGFFPALRALCDKYGILLIADEVQSGMGRTGKWWAIQHFGVEPDIVCSAKGIASGMPLGAIIARDSIMQDWKPGAHGNTFGGNPVSCAASLATIDLLEGANGTDGMITNASEIGQYLIDGLEEIMPRHPSIGEIRGRGMMIGVELVKDRETREYAKALRDDVIHQAYRNGLLLLGCGKSTLRLMPPLMLEKPLADEALQIIDKSLAEVEAAHGF
ncbi:MAG: acetyl ornithine aminotransferase family protein [Chloroflexi bacterium]|nr:acetyl ornithine aminotransferase family protein [Chloroflexota bacterium]